MSYHLALAICKVPYTLGRENLAEIRRRVTELGNDHERDTGMTDGVSELDPDAYDEIYERLAKQAIATARLEEAVVAASRPLAVLWLDVAIETLLEPLLEPSAAIPAASGSTDAKTLPYDVREERLDGNRYLISGTVTSGDANESYPLVGLLAASGVCDVAEPPKAPPHTLLEVPGSPAIVDGGLRRPECGNTGETVGDGGSGGFSGIGDALITAFLDGSGECVRWKDADHELASFAAGYREVRCEQCGADLGDLSPEDLQRLGSTSEIEGEK